MWLDTRSLSLDGVDFLIKLIAGIANKLAEDGGTFSRDIPQLGPFAYTEVSQEVYVHSKGLLRVVGDNGLTGVEATAGHPASLMTPTGCPSAIGFR